MFENCFSLGGNCATACALSKLGLRNIISGPFDWISTPYAAVLEQIENEFADFMNKENLRCNQYNPTIFHDIKYSLSSMHDIKESYEDEIDAVIVKYQRLSLRFLKTIKQPTVFFRCVLDNDEIDYINANWLYAEEVTKRFNNKNEIVYIIYSHMKPLTKNVRFFRLPVKKTDGNFLKMRYLFQQSEVLINFCRNLIDDDVRNRNLVFDASTLGRIESNIKFEKMLKKCTETMLNDYGKNGYIWKTAKLNTDVIHQLNEKDKGTSVSADNCRIRTDKFVSANNLSDINQDEPILIPLFSENQINAIKEQIRSVQKKNVILSFKDIYPLGIPSVDDFLEWSR